MQGSKFVPREVLKGKVKIHWRVWMCWDNLQNLGAERDTCCLNILQINAVTDKWNGTYLAPFNSIWALKALTLSLWISHTNTQSTFNLTSIQTLIFRWMHWGQFGVQYRAQGYFDSWTGGAWDGATDLSIGRCPTLPLEPHLQHTLKDCRHKKGPSYNLYWCTCLLDIFSWTTVLNRVTKLLCACCYPLIRAECDTITLLLNIKAAK